MDAFINDKSVSLLGVAVGAAVGVGTLLAVQKATKYKPPSVWTPGGAKFGSNSDTAGARTSVALPRGKHDIQLHSCATPNGQKAVAILEEICQVYPDFDYDAFFCGLSGDQFRSGFVDLNPNSKIPALVDNAGDKPTRVFESGSIILYLAEKYPKINLLPTDPAKKAECLNWLFWSIGSAPYLGGGFGHFFWYAKEKQRYPIDRFSMEAKRQLDVLDKLLASNKYICGDDYTVADIAIWPWYGNLVLGRLYGNSVDFLDIKQYKNVLRWANMLEESKIALRRARLVTSFSTTSRKENAFPNKPLYTGMPALRERHSRDDWNIQ